MKKWMLVAVAATLLTACGGESETSPEATVGKSDVAAANGKGDTDEIDAMCEDLGREPGCDPCSIQGWYGDGSCDDFCPVRDTDCGIDEYAFDVKIDAAMSADIEIVYAATKDSFGCTDLIFDELRPKRVPEQIREVADTACVTNSDESTSCVYTFPNELGDGCESVVSFIYLYPRDAAATMEPWAALQFSHDAGHEVGTPESVDCEVIQSGQDGMTPTMMCGNDLLHHDDAGQANVELVLDSSA